MKRYILLAADDFIIEYICTRREIQIFGVDDNLKNVSEEEIKSRWVNGWKYVLFC